VLSLIAKLALWVETLPEKLIITDLVYRCPACYKLPHSFPFYQVSAALPCLNHISTLDSALPCLNRISTLDSALPCWNRISTLDSALPCLNRVSTLDSALPCLNRVSTLDSALPRLSRVSTLDSALLCLNRVSTLDSALPCSNRVSTLDSFVPQMFFKTFQYCLPVYILFCQGVFSPFFLSDYNCVRTFHFSSHSTRSAHLILSPWQIRGAKQIRIYYHITLPVV
jgi:hypothetical protein